MNKHELIRLIVARLSLDLDVLIQAARTAHEAATHEENIPDNKYDTLALEASYVAQGQANRAQEIRQSIEAYRRLAVFPDSEEVRLGSLVSIAADDGSERVVFIGPLEGGLRITDNRLEIMVITPASPLGRGLMGKAVGETVEIAAGSNRITYEIVVIH